MSRVFFDRFEPMIFETSDGKSYDTLNDLTSPERHILQKLFLWESMASGLEQFRRKTAEAFAAGWNNSGPVGMREAMNHIVSELERRLLKRLSERAERSQS